MSATMRFFHAQTQREIQRDYYFVALYIERITGYLFVSVSVFSGRGPRLANREALCHSRRRN